MTPEPAAGPALRIAQVARLTGVGVHTIRAWERRHGIPAPARTGGGQRLYTDRDVALIRSVRDLAGQGLPLAVAAERARIEVMNAALPGVSGAEAHQQRLITALLGFDELAARVAWAAVMESFDLMSAMERVAVPCLVAIGDGWHAGSVSVAQEHFATTFIRGQLETLNRQVAPLPGSPTVVVACLEGEHHELGPMMLSALLRFQGLRTIYLGQNVPSDALVRTTEDTQPAVLAVSAGTPAGARQLSAIICVLQEVAPLTALVYGGRGFDLHPGLRLAGDAQYGGPGLAGAVTMIRQLAHSGARGGLS